MNPVISAQCAQFKQEKSLHHLNSSEVFEVYSIFSVLRGQLGFSVDPLDAHLRGDEFGLDGVAILINGQLCTDTDAVQDALENQINPEVEFIFFQSKTGSAFDYGDITKVFDAIEQFFRFDHYHESLQLSDLSDCAKIIYTRAVTRRNPGIRIYYCTTGIYQKPDRTERLLINRKKRLIDRSMFDPSRFTIELVGAERLQTLYRSATRATQACIEFPRQVPLPKVDKVDQAYIGFISGSELIKLVELKDESGEVTGIDRTVFYDNVRDYKGSSLLNSSIAETIDNNEGEDFVFRNNGITVIAKSIHRTADEFRLDDYQIVNGCQTTNILFSKRENLANISVPLRLIGTSDNDFISSIIIGTNSQNAIRDEQFLALMPFVKNLEEYCRHVDESHIIYIERRESQFNQRDIERARIMPLTILMKAVSATLLRQPNRSARDFKKIFKENSDFVFKADDDVRLYHAIAYLYYRLEFLWRNLKISSDLKLFRFYILWAIFTENTDNSNLTKPIKTNKMTEYVQKLLAVAGSDSALKDAAEKYGKALFESGAATPESREKLRDNIRSDSYFAGVKAKLGR